MVYDIFKMSNYNILLGRWVKKVTQVRVNVLEVQGEELKNNFLTMRLLPSFELRYTEFRLTWKAFTHGVSCGAQLAVMFSPLTRPI